MKILIIGPAWVGDMVMSQSLYIELKKQHPQAQIDVLAPAWCKPLLARMVQVNQAIEMPIGHGQLNLRGRLQLAKQLKKQQYDHAIILPNSAKSALIPFLAKIAVRTGWKGEMRYGLLNDLRPDRKVFQYMVERYVALAYSKSTMQINVNLKHITAPKLEINQQNQSQCLAKLGIDAAKPMVGLCAGAEFGPAKRWPEAHYANLAQFLITQGNQVLLFGSEKDKPTTDAIYKQLPASMQDKCFDLAGKTSLEDAVDLLAACHGVAANDSGLMHIAAAVGCKIIAIYGSSSPQYTPPLASQVKIVNTDISCRPCFKRICPYGHQKCLTELSPQQVIEAYKELQ